MGNQVRADFVSDKVTAVYDMTLLERIVPGMIVLEVFSISIAFGNSTPDT